AGQGGGAAGRDGADRGRRIARDRDARQPGGGGSPDQLPAPVSRGLSVRNRGRRHRPRAALLRAGVFLPAGSGRGLSPPVFFGGRLLPRPFSALPPPGGLPPLVSL